LGVYILTVGNLDVDKREPHLNCRREAEVLHGVRAEVRHDQQAELPGADGPGLPRLLREGLPQGAAVCREVLPDVRVHQGI
jgi:hypothetical protein